MRNKKILFFVLIVFSFSFLVVLNNGYNFRIQGDKGPKLEVKNWNNDFLKDLNKNKLFYKKCIINSNKKDIDFILFGDSHAEMYAQAFLNYSKNYNKNFCFVSSLVTCNFLKNDKDKSFIKTDCKKRKEILINFFSKEKFSNLIISHAWFTLQQRDLHEIKIRYENFYNEMFGDQQKNIVFLLSVPEFSNGISMESCSSFPKYIVKKRNCYSALKNTSKIKQNDNINKLIQSEIQNSLKGNSFFLNPYDYLCDSIKCKQVIDEHDVYIDQDHLSLHSSNLLVKFWKNKLINLMK